MPGRPAFPGGDIAAADATASHFAFGSAIGFWIHCSTKCRLVVNSSATLPTTLDDTNAAPLAAATLYGPFYRNGVDTHIHVSGAGAASAVIITLV